MPRNVRVTKTVQFKVLQISPDKHAASRVTAKDPQQKWQLFDLVLNVYDGENNRIGLCRFDARTLIEKTDADMSSNGVAPPWPRQMELCGLVLYCFTPP